MVVLVLVGEVVGSTSGADACVWRLVSSCIHSSVDLILTRSSSLGDRLVTLLPNREGLVVVLSKGLT